MKKCLNKKKKYGKSFAEKYRNLEWQTKSLKVSSNLKFDLISKWAEFKEKAGFDYKKILKRMNWCNS